MGRYPTSQIHEWWSDWHFKNEQIKRTAWLSDVDDTKTLFGSIRRTWAEQRPEKGIVAIIELKWLKSSNDGLTRTEQALLNFYEKHDVPFYIIAIENLDEFGKVTASPIFHIFRPLLSQDPKGYQSIASLSESQMVAWINADYDFEFLQKEVMNT